jgi:hypothetical protein
MDVLPINDAERYYLLLSTASLCLILRITFYRLFDYIENRVERLTKNMDPSK